MCKAELDLQNHMKNKTRESKRGANSGNVGKRRGMGSVT
jgi:hypothetical protein